MDLKSALYSAAAIAWTLLVIGTWIAVDLGHAEPWLSFSEVPGGSTGGMAAAIALMAVGWAVVSRFNRRHENAMWEEAGRQAGLDPSGDDRDASGPELAGTVDGRTVTAWYDKRTRGGGGENSGRFVTFTLAEAELGGPTDEGVVVGRAGGRLHVDDGVGTLEFDEMAETAGDVAGLVVVESGDLVLVGTSPAVVETVAQGLSGDALRAVSDLKIAALGDAAGVVERWAEARNEELEGSIAEFPVDNFVGRVPGDAATVTVETRASLRDGDTLRRFLEGVVAVADAFEEATAHSSASR